MWRLARLPFETGLGGPNIDLSLLEYCYPISGLESHVSLASPWSEFCRGRRENGLRGARYVPVAHQQATQLHALFSFSPPRPR